jgi:hypothetical protein
MKKRIHFLTIRDHRKQMVVPDQQWCADVRSAKYWERFRPRHILGDAPSSTRYRAGVDDHNYAAVAYFVSFEAAKEWMEEQNAKDPPPPKPAPPPPPFPIGTYYVLEARYYEVRQITRKTKAGVQTFVGNEWERPYGLVSGWGPWQEKFIAKYDDREQALTHLRRLIHK